MVKPILNIVADLLKDTRQLYLFESLVDSFDITVNTIDTSPILKTYDSSLALRVFPNVLEMPSYMRHLEEHIQGSDLIIGIGTANLASFQALRIAEKHGISFASIVTDSLPFMYNDFPNIRAVQKDIFDHSSLFLACLPESKDVLHLEGVDSKLIYQLAPNVDFKRLAPQAKRRNRFRSHIKVTESEILFLVPDITEKSAHNLFLGIKLAKNEGIAGLERSKFLILCPEENSKEIKYKCQALGLGASVMFLHQDTDQFYLDLLSAADAYILPGELDSNRLLYFQELINDAIGAGLFPIVRSCLAARAIDDKQCIGLKDGSFHSLSEGIKVALGRMGDHAWSLRLENAKFLSSDEPRENKLAEVLLGAIREKSPDFQSLFFTECLSDVTLAYTEGRYEDASCLIERAFLNFSRPEPKLAGLYEIKGHISRKNSQFEDAMEAYESCLRITPENVGALTGLGHVALAGQAYDDSIAFFRKAMSYKPDSVDATHGMALVANQIGLKAEALFWIEKSYLVAPQNPSVCSSLIRMSLDCPVEAMAVSLLEHILTEASSRDPKIVRALAQIYYKTGEIEKSQTLMTEVDKVAS